MYSKNTNISVDVFSQSMRLTQLRSFYAVGKHGSVTAAARALHVSQPTVTTQVRDLEESYGVELFHRNGRRIILTAAGETLFAIAQRMFGNEQEAIDFLKESAGLSTGVIHVGAVGPLHAMEIVAAFHRRYPGLRVSIRLGNSEETVRGLLSYETDVAVLAQYGANPLLHYVPYRQHPLVIIVPATHRLARRRSVRLEELRNETVDHARAWLYHPQGAGRRTTPGTASSQTLHWKWAAGRPCAKRSYLGSASRRCRSANMSTTRGCAS